MLNDFDDLMKALSAGDSSGFEQLYYGNLQKADSLYPQGMGADLVLAHLEIMRDRGDPIPKPALAVEALIKRNLALLKQPQRH